MSWVDDYKKDMGVQDTGVAQPTGQKKLNWTEDYKNDAQAGTLESVTAQPKTSWMPDLGNLIPEDSPVNAVLTQQDLNEMGGTVKGLADLVIHPEKIVGGGVEFLSALPGMLAGSIGAGQEVAKAVAHDPSGLNVAGRFFGESYAPKTTLKDYWDAGVRGFHREAAKLPPVNFGVKNTELVGGVLMSPLEGIMKPLHMLAESDAVNNIPVFGEDINAVLKLAGVAAGLFFQHGMSARGQVYDPKIKLFKEKAQEGRLTEADKSELGTMIKEMDKEIQQIKDGTLTTLNVDPLAKLDEAYKPEPPQVGAKPTGEPTHTFVSNRGNEYVKIDGSWYSKDTSNKVTNKHIIAAAEAKAQTLDVMPAPKTLAESHQQARKESETTKALHEARTGAEARRMVNEEFQQEIERARKAKETPEVEIVEDIDFNAEAKKALEETGETKPVGPVPETKPVVELDPKAPDYVAQTFKHRDIEIKTGKAEKRSIQARLKKARKEGEISHGDAVRGTTIDELLDLLRTKPGESLRSKSETGQIHATPMLEGVNETVPIYGDHAKHSVAIIIPKKHTMKKEGAHTVEVLVNPETPITELRFIIGKDKRILTADQVKQELLKLKEEKPKVETKVETRPVEPIVETKVEPVEPPKVEPVEPAPTAIKLHKGEEAPKASVETKVPEFPKEALKDLEDSEAPKKAKKKQVLEVDGVEEYDIVSREYGSLEEAQRAAEKSPQLAKRRKELAETGVSLEVVKVGDKFYAAERLSMTDVERQAIMDALEGSEKTTVVEPDVAMERLKAIAPEVVKWHKGDSSIPIDALMDEVASMVEGSKGKTDPLMAEVVTAADKMLTLVKEKQQAQLLPQKTGELMVAKSPKNPKLDIVLDKNGQPFEDMVDALNYMNEHGLKGVVESSADGKGFVIELRKPTALVRTKLESLTDAKAVLELTKHKEKITEVFDSLKQEELADLGTVESSKPKGRGKRKIVEETLASESGQTTFFTDMWKWAFKKSHKPTLSAAEFQKLPGQRIEALRRLVKDAMDKGISVEDLAKGLGFDETQARYIQGLAKDVMHYVDRNMSYHDTNAFKSGAAINGGPTTWNHKKTKEQLWVPEISQGELAELKAAKVIDKGLTGGLTREWLPTVHAANDFKSPLVRALHRDSQRLQVKVDKDIRTLRRTLAAKQKDAGKGSGDRIYIRALWEQKDLRERMEAGGITEADIPVLTPKEQAVYQWMRDEFELAYPEINDVRAHIGKRRMRYTPDYMTLCFADGWASKAGHAPNSVLDTWGLVNRRVKQFKETKFDFSKTRSKKKALSQISENAYDVFNRYMEQKIRFTTLSPLISKIAQMNKGLKDGIVHYTTKKGEAKTKPKIYMLKHKNPVLSEFLNRWSNHLAGKDISAVLHLSDTPSNRFLEKTVRKVCGNVAVTTLGFMFRSAAIQVSALRNTMVVAGLPYTALGALESLRPKNFRETLKESGLVEYRRGETILEDWYKYTEKGGYEGLKKASMAMLQFMDVHTAVASYRALKRYALKELKLKEKEARKYADEMITQTQASALPGDIAPIQRSTLGKAMTMFQTFTINDWAFMYKEVFGIDRTLSRKEKVKRMVAWAVGTAAFTSLFEDGMEVNSPFSTPFRTMYRLRDMDVPIKDKVKVVGKEFIEPLPGVGGAARYGSHPLGVVVDLIGQFFRDDPMARSWFEIGGRFAPAPGFAQANKSWRGVRRGADFWEILMGQPPAKQKILGRTPGRKTVKY